MLFLFSLNKFKDFSMTSSLELNSAYFANISFVFLFLAMTFYWINLAFFDKQTPNLVKTTAFEGLLDSESTPNGLSNTLEVKQTGLFSFLISFLPTGKKKLTFSNLPKLTLVLANISLILLLCTRWKESGHFPLSNL